MTTFDWEPETEAADYDSGSLRNVWQSVCPYVTKRIWGCSEIMSPAFTWKHDSYLSNVQRSITVQSMTGNPLFGAGHINHKCMQITYTKM